ncbi:acyl-CoA thioesterase [Psychrobacter cryohalolentis]|uniref:Thioesterase superfamily n=1 Tax=Psychrobacter cryohalolentis (strain ATCC BAA-1226 / DSM 17306 / VKM B-2378 / K5) TaxID=335284 RepID=Q1QEL8_PSYCK|nr:acyl-CoA thioesterase [Psychrobacter cryohalolentis]ABE73885.1 thioesterase superfamily [Psychrobacter cryohalolentis K5]ASE26523.1 acyl-CoA thioesterase [Psychrobacter cryohalolentis]
MELFNQTSIIDNLDNHCPEELAHYPIIHQQPIHWGEMDAFNHLNNVVYYRYAESARIGYLQALGMFDGNMVTVLAQSSCQYLHPVIFPDILLLGVRCQRLGTTSIVIEYSYYSKAQAAIVATAEAVIVRLESNGQDKKPWTNEERERLLALEATFGHIPQL